VGWALVFIHGGYWQMNAKESFAFIAEGPLAHGINVAFRSSRHWRVPAVVSSPRCAS
jgi:hypothetical protein